MLYPEVNKLTGENISRYALVIAVAKHARQISEGAEKAGEHLRENPVKLSINDFASDRVKILQHSGE